MLGGTRGSTPAGVNPRCCNVFSSSVSFLGGKPKANPSRISCWAALEANTSLSQSKMLQRLFVIVQFLGWKVVHIHQVVQLREGCCMVMLQPSAHLLDGE